MAAATSFNNENFLRLKSGEVFKRAHFQKLMIYCLKFQTTVETKWQTLHRLSLRAGSNLSAELEYRTDTTRLQKCVGVEKHEPNGCRQLQAYNWDFKASYKTLKERRTSGIS